MNQTFSRRTFLQTSAAGAALWGLAGSALEAAPVKLSAPNAEKLGWRLACCTYTFRKVSFYEAMEKSAALGVRYLEGFSWQTLAPGDAKVKLDVNLTAAQRKEVCQRLDAAGMKLVNCYLQNLPNQEDVCRKWFDWAKDLGLEEFVVEPPPEAFDLIARLCDEYKVNVAVHNHPKPSSRYWDPQAVVDVCRNRTKRVGCCADTGHWVRSGLDPVAALKLLGDRVLSLHLKDIVEAGAVKSPDCPWGDGQGQIRAILAELHRQKLKVVIGIEYERHDGTEADVVKSIAFLDQVAADLLRLR
jgi:sugar phosphate isomerase/epimerase